MREEKGRGKKRERDNIHKYTANNERKYKFVFTIIH